MFIFHRCHDGNSRKLHELVYGYAKILVGDKVCKQKEQINTDPWREMLEKFAEDHKGEERANVVAQWHQTPHPLVMGGCRDLQRLRK